MVPTIVPPALQRACHGRIKTAPDFCGFNNFRSTTILEMARGMEPVFAISTTVYSIKFQGSIANHGVHTVANNKRTRNIVPDLNTETLLYRQIRRQITIHHCGGGNIRIHFITFFILCASISTSNNLQI